MSMRLIVGLWGREYIVVLINHGRHEDGSKKQITYLTHILYTESLSD